MMYILKTQGLVLICVLLTFGYIVYFHGALFKELTVWEAGGIGAVVGALFSWPISQYFLEQEEVDDDRHA